MSLEPDATKSEALEQARAKHHRVAAAFEAVFGQPRRRSDAQQIVFDELTRGGEDDSSNSYRFDGSSKDGLALIAAGIHRDGAKTIIRIINRQLAIAAKVKVAKPAPTKTKR